MQPIEKIAAEAYVAAKRTLGIENPMPLDAHSAPQYRLIVATVEEAIKIAKAEKSAPNAPPKLPAVAPLPTTSRAVVVLWRLAGDMEWRRPLIGLDLLGLEPHLQEVEMRKRLPADAEVRLAVRTTTVVTELLSE